jgi:hypothetical protein
MDNSLLEHFSRPDCHSWPVEHVPPAQADPSAFVAVPAVELEQHVLGVARLLDLDLDQSAFAPPFAVAIQPDVLHVGVLPLHLSPAVQ